MAIYTRFGTRVNILLGYEVPVWIERTKRAEVKWHYEPKKPTKQTEEIEEVPVWHAVAEDADTGRLICDGQQIPCHEFKADGGLSEILDEMRSKTINIIKYDGRVSISIEFLETEDQADRYGQYIRKSGRTYNGGYFHGMPCGREKHRDYTKDGVTYYAVTI